MTNYIKEEDTYYQKGAYYQNKNTINMSYFIFNNENLFENELLKKEIEFEQEKINYISKENIKTALEIYSKILILQKKESVLNKEKDIYKEILLNKKELYSVGETNKLNMIDSTMEFIEIEKQLDTLKKELLQEKNNLNELVNSEIQYPLIDFTNSSSEKDNLSELNLKLKEIEKKKTELEFLEYADIYPVIKLDSTYNLYTKDEKYNDSFSGTNNLYQVGISLQWELFSGFSSSYKKNKANLELKKLVLEKENTENKINNIKKDLENLIENNDKYIKENENKLSFNREMNKEKQISKDELLLSEINFLNKNLTIYQIEVEKSLQLKKLELGAY